jgi:hypothetical protein
LRNATGPPYLFAYRIATEEARKKRQKKVDKVRWVPRRARLSGECFVAREATPRNQQTGKEPPNR